MSGKDLITYLQEDCIECSAINHEFKCGVNNAVFPFIYVHESIREGLSVQRIGDLIKCVKILTPDGPGEKGLLFSFMLKGTRRHNVMATKKRISFSSPTNDSSFNILLIEMESNQWEQHQ